MAANRPHIDPKLHFLDPKWGPRAMRTPIGCGPYREQSENGPILTQNGTFWTQNGEPRHEYTRSHWSARGHAKNTPKIALFGPKMGAHIMGTLPGSHMGGEPTNKAAQTGADCHCSNPRQSPFRLQNTQISAEIPTICPCAIDLHADTHTHTHTHSLVLPPSLEACAD